MTNNSSAATKITFDCFPFIRVYENGSIERYVPIKKIPPGEDPKTGVKSRDVVISHEPAISARIFMPKIRNQSTKLPILVYIHGGGLCSGSAFDPIYHNYVASLVHKANVIAVSIEYRLAPEHPVPACFEDSFAALKWVASHANGYGEEPWLNDHADFGHFFLAGESSGATISYNIAVSIGASGLPGVRLEGLVIVHPFFRGRYDKLSLYLFPNGLDHPGLNPNVEDVSRIGFDRILTFVAEKDSMKNSGLLFHEKVKESNRWKGKAELVVSEGVNHVFHLYKPNSEQALSLMNKIVSFINNQEEVNWRSKI